MIKKWKWSPKTQFLIIAWWCCCNKRGKRHFFLHHFQFQILDSRYSFFGIAFALYFLKLTDGKGFKYQIPGHSFEKGDGRAAEMRGRVGGKSRFWTVWLNHVFFLFFFFSFFLFCFVFSVRKWNSCARFTKYGYLHNLSRIVNLGAKGRKFCYKFKQFQKFGVFVFLFVYVNCVCEQRFDFSAGKTL